MKHVKIITLALVAAVCLSAVAASSAFALSGEISKNATKSELPTLKGFKGESKKEGFLETVAGSKVSCTNTSITGSIETTTTGKATFSFTGCTSSGLKCKTSNTTTAGEIKVEVGLKGQVKGGKDLLENKVPETTLTCSTIKIIVKGALLIPAEPTGKLSKTYTFNGLGSKGVQKPDDAPVEAHLTASFAGKAFENASIQAEGLATTFEEEVAFI